MIGRLKGIVIHKQPPWLVVDVNGYRKDRREALERFTDSLRIARHNQDAFAQTIALHHLGWAELLLGQVNRARESFDESLAISARQGPFG